MEEYKVTCKCGKPVRRKVLKNKPSVKVKSENFYTWYFVSVSHPDGLCDTCDYYKRNPRKEN
jgi:hypothetical protein